MEAKAVVRQIRISPTKARLVANQVRGRGFLDALEILTYLPNKGANIIKGAIQSARANADVIAENGSLSVNDDELFVKKIYVDEGAIFRRFMPRARGSASRIRKRTAHITVVLGTE